MPIIEVKGFPAGHEQLQTVVSGILSAVSSKLSVEQDKVALHFTTEMPIKRQHEYITVLVYYLPALHRTDTVLAEMTRDIRDVIKMSIPGAVVNVFPRKLAPGVGSWG